VFNGVGIFGSTMIVILIAACLAGVNQALSRPTGEAARGPGSALPTARASSLELSWREQEILRLVAQGSSNAAIATQLGMSERAIKASLERLLTRLNVRNRAEAVAAASRLQLL
jgi:DNA-binding NarL/FixJ family response regulator